MRACICSLLEISDEGVPNFVEDDNYPMQLVEFLKEKGYRLRNSKVEPKGIKYYMAVGISPRGLNHVVIYQNGKMIYDPHPDGGGVKDIMLYEWLERRD